MAQASPMWWSHVACYEKCPQRALWQYGYEGIDVGNGPGRKKTPPKDKSRHFAVQGTTIQKVLEHMYNQEEWKHPVDLQKRLLYLSQTILRNECDDTYIDWNRTNLGDMEESVQNGVLGYLRTMKHHKLLGPYARSEVNLMGSISKPFMVSGKVDFIIRREDTGVTILDGKNSQVKMKYDDPDQLRWYALCFLASYQQLPDRLGFVWYQHPYDEQSGEEGVEWVSVTKRDLRELRERAEIVYYARKKGKFEAKPEPSYCKYCDFESVCPERQAQIASNRTKKPSKSKSLDIAKEVEDDFGF